MPLINASHDSLPYIEPAPTDAERARIEKLLSRELPPSYNTTLHPSLPTIHEPSFSPAITAELERVSRKEPLQAIDTSRYEALSAPEDPNNIDAWHDVLIQAYTSSTYLNQRQTNLSLLETFGKNAWLIGNSQLESILESLERELASTKKEVEEVNRLRKSGQEGVRGEMTILEQRWKEGVGKVLEVEVAAEGVRQEILQRRREGAR